MKTKIQPIILVLVFCMSVEGMANPFSEKKAENLVNALTNNALAVGVFKAWSSSDEETWFTLRSGEDSWKKFYQLRRITQFWQVMKTTAAIRGSFDHLIFFTEGLGGLDKSFENFTPYSDSKWILILRKQFNEAGELSPSAGEPIPGLEDYTQALLDENPFFNSENLFKVFDHSRGAFQIGWTAEYPPDVGEEMYSTNLVTRLQEIVTSPDFPPDAAFLRQQVEDALFECFLGTYTPPIEKPDEYVTVFSNGQEISINERKIKNLVNALTNATLQIGTFNVELEDSPGENGFLLRNGEDIWEYVIRFHSNWRIMKAESAIRGDFDRLIFFTEEWGILPNDKYFRPILQTQWILILENQFDEMGNLLPGSEYTPEILNENPFFNPETLFKVYDHRYGAFYLNWEEGRRPADGEEMYSTNLVTRLQEIVASPDFPPDAATLRQQVEDALFECFLGTYTPPPEESGE